MLMRTVSVVAMIVLCGAVAWEITSPPKPYLIYNKSESAPIGWYKLNPNGAIRRSAIVAAYAPSEARKLAAMREYLPGNVPLIKTVWAVGGDRICSENGVISAPNRPDIYAHREDSLGRKMPQITGCFTLKETQVFLVSFDVQTSWDSRYFGAVPIRNILGTVHYLGDHRDGLVVLGGRARARTK